MAKTELPHWQQVVVQALTAVPDANGGQEAWDKLAPDEQRAVIDFAAACCEGDVQPLLEETRQQLDEDILAFVNENITNNQLSIRMLAMHYGRSESYLSMRFKEQVGMTFSAYVEQMRIQLASKMLAESGSSITEISGRVGYSSSSAFGRAYKRVMGCTPSEYQATLGGE